MTLEVIRAKCNQSNTTFKRLERELGFGNGSIRRWEEHTPTIDKVARVADFFGCTVDELMRRNGAGHAEG